MIVVQSKCISPFDPVHAATSTSDQKVQPQIMSATIDQNETKSHISLESRSTYAVMFEMPMLPQGGSPLLALPSEIRTPILMHLVTSTEAIPVIHDSDDEPQQVHLAILRVCQQLYQEGFVLFVAHNVPHVLITINDQSTWVMDWHNGRDGPCEAIAYNKFLKDAVPKFSRLRFEFSECEELARSTRPRRIQSVKEGLKTAARWIEKCDLNEKEVTFAFDPKSIHVYDMYKGTPHWPLLYFGDIRCKKVHLLGVEDDVHKTNLIRAIEGRLSVPNLKAACEEVIDHFQRCLHANGRSDNFLGDDYYLWSPLRDAARLYNIAECEKIRARLMARCELEVQEFIRRHEEFKVIAARPIAID